MLTKIVIKNKNLSTPLEETLASTIISSGSALILPVPEA